MARCSKYGDIDIPGIPDDEPVFAFRAQDMLAPAVLEFYASLRDSCTGDFDVAGKIRLDARKFITWPTRKMPT